MAIVTHGTTLAGFKAIMSGAGKAGLPNPWTVSNNDGYMYFYDALSVAEDYGDEESEEFAQYARNESYENATLQVAMTGKAGLVVVLTCEIPDDMLEADYSCDNMQHARTIRCSEFDPSFIKEIHVCSVDQWSIPFHLSSVIENSMFNTGALPEKLVKLASVCGFNEDVYDYSLEPVDVQEFIAENA